MEIKNIQTFKDICRKLGSIAPESSVWEMDGRFNTAAVSFENSFSEEILSAVTGCFPNKWEKKTARKAPESIKKIIKFLSGLENGQFIFTTDDDDEILYAAWWPWGNGLNVSLRIGIEASSMTIEEATELLSQWFNI